MNTKRPIPPVNLEALFDAVIRAAVREDMARIYGEEHSSEPREATPARKPKPIFSRRQAE